MANVVIIFDILYLNLVSDINMDDMDDDQRCKRKHVRWLGGGGASCLLVIVGTGSARFCARARPTQYPASVIKIHVNIKPNANDIFYQQNLKMAVATTLAGDDARPLDGDNGMCDDDGLLRS